MYILNVYIYIRFPIFSLELHNFLKIRENKTYASSVFIEFDTYPSFSTIAIVVEDIFNV